MCLFIYLELVPRLLCKLVTCALGDEYDSWIWRLWELLLLHPLVQLRVLFSLIMQCLIYSFLNLLLGNLIYESRKKLKHDSLPLNKFLLLSQIFSFSISDGCISNFGPKLLYSCPFILCYIVLLCSEQHKLRQLNSNNWDERPSKLIHTNFYSDWDFKCSAGFPRRYT